MIKKKIKDLYKGTSIAANAGIGVPFYVRLYVRWWYDSWNHAPLPVWNGYNTSAFVLFAQKRMISIDYYVKNVSKGSKPIIEMV